MRHIQFSITVLYKWFYADYIHCIALITAQYYISIVHTLCKLYPMVCCAPDTLYIHFLPSTHACSIQVPPSSSQTQEGMLTTPQAQEEQCVTTPQAQEEQCITTSQAQEEQCVTTPQLQTTSLSPHEWWSTASHDHYGTPVQTLDPVRGYYSNMYAPPPCVPYYSQSMHTLPYHT